MTTLSPSPLVVSLIQAATSMPIFLLALPAGALADVIDRRRRLLFSQGWMLLAAAALGLLTLEGMATPLAVLALSFALGVGAALNAPAWQAIVPELVGRDAWTRADTAECSPALESEAPSAARCWCGQVSESRATGSLARHRLYLRRCPRGSSTAERLRWCMR